MKLVLKTFKIVAVVISLLFVLLFTITIIKQDKVGELFINELNKKINTKVEFGSSKLSLFRKFPLASFEFKNILIHSSKGYNNREFGKYDTDTLLFAKTLSLDFGMKDLYNGKYNIEKIDVEKGKMVILSDSAGLVNYEFTEPDDTSTTSVFSLNLKNVGLTDVSLIYFNTAISLKIKSILKTARLRGKIEGDNIDIIVKSNAQITNFSLYEKDIKQPVDVDIEVNMLNSDKGYLFRKGALDFENITLALSGSISETDIMNILLTGETDNIPALKKYLPESYLQLFEDYNPTGVLNMNGKLTGPLSSTITPHFDIGFTITKGEIENIPSKISLSNISFTGSFNNGELNRSESSVLTINNLLFNLGTSNYSGVFSVSNFQNPYITLDLNGKLVFRDLKEFINLPHISSSEGFITASLKLSGVPGKKDKYTFSDFLKLNPEADFTFNDFSIGLKKESIRLKDISGNIKLKENVQARNLSVTYNGHKIQFDGQIVNLPEWLAGQPVVLKTTADISFSSFDPETILSENPTSGDSTMNSIKLPSDIILDLNVKSDTFKYKSFLATSISGRLTYQPGYLEFSNVSFNALSGRITGTGFLTQGMNRSFITKGDFTVDKLDVNETFRTFRDFGQTYIKAENIQGTLSGSFTLLSTLDSLLKPDVNSLVADGKYSLSNGELVNFEPIKELSDYIELSELEDISFSNLENEFLIRNNVFTIPLMDIKSSAADLSIKGTYNFNGDYEYHIKILLSELLSRKKRNANKGKNQSDEFGAIADDGLGRTSLLLKMTQTGTKSKVSYDIEAAKGLLKEDFKTEKQTLKTILKEEYGLFKKDSVFQEKTVKPATEPRFKITWEDE